MMSFLQLLLNNLNVLVFCTNSCSNATTHCSFSSLGSSTACIIVFDNVNHILYSANLGDSGFLVVREGKVVHRSEEQQHYFNTPFQLSIAPPDLNSVLSDRYVSLYVLNSEKKKKKTIQESILFEYFV